VILDFRFWILDWGRTAGVLFHKFFNNADIPIRHSRENGNPGSPAHRLDSRVRGNDEMWSPMFFNDI